MFGDDDGVASVANASSRRRTISKKLKLIQDVREALDIGRTESKNISGLRNRTEMDFSDYDEASRRQLTQFTMKTVQSLCDVILSNDSNALFEAVVMKTSKVRTASEHEKLKGKALTLIEAFSQTSTQQRVLEATLAKHYSNEVLVIHGIGRWRATTCRKNFDFVKNEKQELQLPKRSIRKYSTLKVRHKIDFILNDADVQRISWGTKKREQMVLELNFLT